MGMSLAVKKTGYAPITHSIPSTLQKKKKNAKKNNARLQNFSLQHYLSTVCAESEIQLSKKLR